MSQVDTDSSLVDQLESLYEEKEKLNRELGVADPDEIIDMVRSLQEQVESFYETHDQSH